MKKQILILAGLITLGSISYAQKQQLGYPYLNNSCENSSNLISNSQNNNLIEKSSRINLFNTRATVWKWDTIVTYNLSGLMEKFINTYDVSGNVIVQLIKQWDNNSWVDSIRITKKYNSNDNVLTELTEEWKNNNWQNVQKISHSYNAKDQWSSKLTEQWQNNAWMNSHKSIFFYDTNGNPSKDSNLIWQSNSWINSTIDSITFDVFKKLLNYSYYLWQNNKWEKANKFTYTYNTQGNVLTELWEKGQSDNWVNDVRYTYTYDINGIILSDFCDRWYTNIWEPLYKETYTSDLNSNISSIILAYWNGSWDITNRNSFIYDEDNNSIKGKCEFYSSGIWIPAVNLITLYVDKKIQYFINYPISSYEASFKSMNVGITQNNNNNSIKVYPNPATNNITIVNMESLKDKVISIYNIQGQILIKLPLIQNKTLIDISNLLKGIYVIKISGNDKTRLMKFVKE